MFISKQVKLVKYTDKDYEFVYEVKKNAYKKYVEECWGSWIEKDQRKYFDSFISKVQNDAFIIYLDNKKLAFIMVRCLKAVIMKLGIFV